MDCTGKIGWYNLVQPQILNHQGFSSHCSLVVRPNLAAIGKMEVKLVDLGNPTISAAKISKLSTVPSFPQTVWPH